MRQKFTTAALAAFLISGWVGMAQAEDCKLRVGDCVKCDMDQDYILRQGHWVGKSGKKRCLPITHKFCSDESTLVAPDFNKEERQKLMARVSEAIIGKRVYISENLDVALAMAEKNPWAAEAFVNFIESSKEGNLSERANDAWGMDFVDPSELTAKKVQDAIRGLHEAQGPEETPAPKNGVKIHEEAELRRTADGGAYLEIRISTGDAQFLEVSRILPDIRVLLRPAKNAPKDSDGSHWDVVGWEY